VRRESAGSQGACSLASSSVDVAPVPSSLPTSTSTSPVSTASIAARGGVGRITVAAASTQPLLDLYDGRIPMKEIVRPNGKESHGVL